MKKIEKKKWNKGEIINQHNDNVQREIHIL